MGHLGSVATDGNVAREKPAGIIVPICAESKSQQQGVKFNTAPQVLLEPLAPLCVRLVHLFHIPVYFR
jgi:hypothetical protein